jgi:hypothetical protein
VIASATIPALDALGVGRVMFGGLPRSCRVEVGFARRRSVLGEPPGEVAERDWLCCHAGDGSARTPLTVADRQSQSTRVSVGAGSSRFGDETGTGRVDPKLVLV